MRYDIAALKQRLEGIRTEDHPALVRQKSRDFYWYSPVLKRQLDAVTADIVVGNARSACSVAGVNFDYEDLQAAEKAYRTIQDLVRAAGEIGYGEYRAHPGRARVTAAVRLETCSLA